MPQSAALTQFLQALNDIREYHVLFELTRDLAREGAHYIPDAKFRSLFLRHVTEDRFQEFDMDAWRASAEVIFTQRLGFLDALSPNNLLIVVLVAHFEAFLEDLRAERGYPPLKSRRKSAGNDSPEGKWQPGYYPLKLAYKGFGADLRGSRWSWEDLDELAEKRHCIVHRGSRVDDDYLEKLQASPRLGPHRPCLPPDGDVWRVYRLHAKKVVVGYAELKFHLDQLHEIAIFLDATCVGPTTDTTLQ